MRRQARYEEAAAEYEAVVQRIPDSARAYAVAGIPLMFIGRYSDAVRAFERSVALEPSQEAYVNWGMTLFRMRQFDQADDKLAQARKLGAVGHQVLGNAGRIAFYRKRPEEATELYRRAIAAAQSDLASPARKQDANTALAEYSAKLGQADEARAYLKVAGIDPASKTQPNDPHLLFFAAMVLNQLGDRGAALEWLGRAVYWGVPPSELVAFPELDSLRDEPAFKNLIARK
jgi:tetratricopeptide (TPR) repeat protein